MRYTEPGIIGDSFVNFTIPSDFARSALYCCPQTGLFYCTTRYDISREYYDWFLMFYVCEGTLVIETDGQQHRAHPNEIALLDCHRPHRYYCTENGSFMWFHFFGNNSEEYSRYLTSQGRHVFSGERIQWQRQLFSGILRQTGATIINEHLLSRDIGSLLCTLATSQQSMTLIASPIVPALNYIAAHYAEDIDLDHLTSLCMISKPHLIRCFRKELNCTPHDYLLDYRLRESKQLLSSSTSSVEDISEQCGFNSVSHFSRAFRKRVGMTPSEFRKIWKNNG